MARKQTTPVEKVKKPYTLTDFIHSLEKELLVQDEERKDKIMPIKYAPFGISGNQEETIRGQKATVFIMDWRSTTCAALKDKVVNAFTWDARETLVYVRLSAGLIIKVDEDFIPKIFNHEESAEVSYQLLRNDI